MAADISILALTLAGIALAGFEASFAHGRTRFLQPGMWVPPAYLILALWLGGWYLAAPDSALPRLGLYYLLWVGLAVGLTGEFFHLRRAKRLAASAPRGRYRALAAGPQLTLPLLFTLLSLFGLLAF